MEKEMRRHSLLAVLPWILICLAGGALILGLLTQGKTFVLLSGPKALDTVSDEELEGSYVSFDKSRVVAVYASASVEDSNGDSEETAYYIILRRGDRYLTLQCNPKQYDRLSVALEQAENYYTGESEDLLGLGTVTGFVETADEDLVETMVTQMESLAKNHKDTGLPGLGEGEEPGDQVDAYVVRMERCGWMPYWLIWVLSGIWVVLFLIALMLIVLQVSGYYQKQYQSYMKRAVTDYTAEALQADWDNAQVFGSIRLGDICTWFYKGAHSYAFLTGEIVWVYKALYARTSDKYRWGITVYLKDHSVREMYMSQDANRSKIIRAYQDKGLTFVSDYKSSYEKIFRDDFDTFLQMAADEKAERERKAREKAMWEQV